MGFIKSGIYAGAAMYGAHEISKAISSRNASPQPPSQRAPHEQYTHGPHQASREQYPSGHQQHQPVYYNDSYQPQQRQLDQRERDYNTREYTEPGQGQQQRLYLEEPERHQPPAYYGQQAENTYRGRSTSNSRESYQNQQHAFVAPEQKSMDGLLGEKKHKEKKEAVTAGGV